ncbi:MAG: hypothetical protein IJ695_10860 [Butyrivibrio sp.]|nr:hypothetical protein [Butyrivibrio sp.]
MKEKLDDEYLEKFKQEYQKNQKNISQNNEEIIVEAPKYKEKSVESLLKSEDISTSKSLLDEEIEEKNERSEIITTDYSKMDVQVGKIEESKPGDALERAKKEQEILSNEAVMAQFRALESYLNDEFFRRVVETDSPQYTRLVDAIAKTRNCLNSEDATLDDKIDSLLYLSESANAYYDSHRGHRWTGDSQYRKDVSKKVIARLRIVFNNLSVAVDRGGEARKRREVPGKAEAKKIDSRINDLEKTYVNWCTNFSKDEIIDERSRVRDKFALLKGYEEDIQKYRLIHQDVAVEKLPYVVRQFFSLVNQVRLLDKIERKVGKKDNDEILTKIRNHAEQDEDIKEKKLIFKEKNEGLDAETIKALEEVDGWFIANINGSGLNNNSEIVKSLLRKSMRERLYIYYLIETDERKDPSMMSIYNSQAYKPDLKKIRGKMVRTRLKVFGRLSGDDICMHKLSDAMRLNRGNKHLIAKFRELETGTEEDEEIQKALKDLDEEKLSDEEKVQVAALKRDQALKTAYRTFARIREEGDKLQKAKTEAEKHEIEDNIYALRMQSDLELKDLIKKDKQVGEANEKLGLTKKKEDIRIQQQDGDMNVLSRVQLTSKTLSSLASGVTQIPWGLTGEALDQFKSISVDGVGTTLAFASNMMAFCAAVVALSTQTSNMHVADIINTVFTAAHALSGSAVNVWTVTEKMLSTNATFVPSQGLQIAGAVTGGATIIFGGYKVISGAADKGNITKAKRYLRDKHNPLQRINNEGDEEENKSKEQIEKERREKIQKEREIRYEKNMLNLSHRLASKKQTAGACTAVAGGFGLAASLVGGTLLGIAMPGVGTVLAVVGLAVIIAHKIADNKLMGSIREKTFDEFFGFENLFTSIRDRMETLGKRIYDEKGFKNTIRRKLAAAAGYADLVSAQIGISANYAELIYDKLFSPNRLEEGDEKQAYIQIVKSLGLPYNEKKKKPDKKLLVRKMCGK